jgi:hypothetical protein
MANKPSSGLASAFDAMLSQNRDRFDTMLHRRPGSTPAAPASTPQEASESVRFLNDRYGRGWHHEVIERRREGDEVIVLCRLTVDELDMSKTQFGSAKIGEANTKPITAGSAGGIAFTLGSEQAGREKDTEEAAFRRALDDGLAKCVALL